MKKILIFVLFTIIVNANNILNISYFTLSNKMDILFSLDSPFNGKIITLDKNHYKITNLSIDRIEQKQFKNNLNILISPLDKNNIDLKIICKENISIKASITAKGYGLRITIIGLETFDKKPIQLNQTKKYDNNNNIYYNYIIVIFILVILIFILIYVKKKMLQKLPKSLQEDNYKILYQKMIDPKNRLVMIEVFNKRYLLLLGDKNNILLDNFSEKTQTDLENISTQNEFGQLFDEELKKNTSDFIKNASKLKGNDEF
jgi:flagellar biogenesis protein FliO